MATIFWRPLPVATLTVRQFLGGKAVRVVTALAFLPCVFALIYLLNPAVSTRHDFLINAVYIGMVISTLLPITVLILATGALGNEIEDRTLPYLTLKPLSRLRIVVEKMLGVLAVTEPIILAGLLVTFAIVFRGSATDHLRLFGAIAASAAVAIFAYSSIFLLISLVIPRALLVGIVYTFVWESVLGRFLPGLRIVSIRHFTESIFVGILNDPTVTMKNPTSTTSSIVTMLIVGIFCIAVATVRLRRMSLD
jgi:ABC-2 type transport system permease protein